MEPDWAQQISRKAWTEQIAHKNPNHNPDDYDSHCHYDAHPHYSSNILCFPEWMDVWFLRRIRKYAELKEM